MEMMRRFCLLFVLVIGCGSDPGDTNPDASVSADAAVDAAPVDAPDMPTVTYPPATLADDAATAKKWAAASAPQLFMLAFTPVAVADATLQIGEETCPTKTVNGDTTTYTGGCTTSNGQPWTGTATQTGAPMGMIEYVDFGGAGTDTCNETEYPSTFEYNGTITPSATEPGALAIKLTAEVTGPDDGNDCAPRTGTFQIDYTLTYRPGTHDADNDGSPDDTYWSGSGKFGNSIDGAVDATTTEERLEEELCDNEALSGATVISSDGHTITITYDGETDCDAESTVRWSYDGADRGEITGVSCSAGGSSGSALVLFAIAFVAVRRRRRQQLVP